MKGLFCTRVMSLAYILRFKDVYMGIGLESKIHGVVNSEVVLSSKGGIQLLKQARMEEGFSVYRFLLWQ